LNKPAISFLSPGRNHGGGQSQYVGIYFKLLAQNGVGHGHPENAAPLLILSGLHQRLVMGLITDEPHILACGFPVIILFEAIGPDIPETKCRYPSRGLSLLTSGRS
jgi:hypothetical protein